MDSQAQSSSIPIARPEFISVVPTDQLGITILYEKADAKVDVVAVHGLGAIPEITWKEKKSGVNWLEHEAMLPSAIPDARIMRFGYDSMWLGRHPVRTNIQIIADNLLAALDRRRRNCKDRPLIFIGHCFGGLVIQKALTTDSLANRQNAGFFDFTVGLIFLGTPHSGTVTFTSRGVSTQANLNVIAMHADLRYESEVLKDLEDNDGALLQVSNDFLRLCRSSNLKVMNFFEQRDSKVGKQIGRDDLQEFVVKRASATLGSYPSEGLPLDHYSLNKFASPHDGNFEAVLAKIEELHADALDRGVGCNNDGRGLANTNITFGQSTSSSKTNNSDRGDQHTSAGNVDDQRNFLYGSKRGTSDLVELLAPVEGAAYNHGGSIAKCQEGTRIAVIAEIKKWVKKDSDGRICWLHGPAGSGKSAISQTIAEWCVREKTLAASFFFLRGAGDRSSIARLVPTLAHQISLFRPTTKRLIRDAVQNEPGITQKPIQHQFEKLITEPIRAVTSSVLSALPWTKPMVIVIDALDECDDKESMSEFVHMLFQLQEMRQLPCRVLVASRVEEHIQKKIDNPAAHVVALPDFDAHVDIRAFFRHSFTTLYRENRLVMRSVPFPSDEDFDALTDKCGGLFIFAVTLMRFIEDPIDLPHRRIKTALAFQTGLDPLYNRIVSATPQSDQFKLVLGTIILLRYPIPIMSLAHLIELEIADVVRSLLGLQSILMIPGRDDEPIQLFHTSLRDFLMDRDRSGALCIPPGHHLHIATKCLTVMLIGPKDGIFYSEKQEYACWNWVYHCLDFMALEGHSSTSDLLSKPSFMNPLTDFLSYHLHYWINTMILNRKLKEVSEAVESMISTLQQLPKPFLNLLQVLQKVQRKVKEDNEAWEDRLNELQNQNQLLNLQELNELLNNNKNNLNLNQLENLREERRALSRVFRRQCIENWRQ